MANRPISAAWRPVQAAHVDYSRRGVATGSRITRRSLSRCSQPRAGCTFSVAIPRNFGRAIAHLDGRAAMGPWLTSWSRLCGRRRWPARFIPFAGAARRKALHWDRFCNARRGGGGAGGARGDHAVKEYTNHPCSRRCSARSDDPTAAISSAAIPRWCDSAYPRRADGKTLFPVRRMFIIATAVA